MHNVKALRVPMYLFLWLSAAASAASPDLVVAEKQRSQATEKNDSQFDLGADTCDAVTSWERGDFPPADRYGVGKSPTRNYTHTHTHTHTHPWRQAAC